MIQAAPACPTLTSEEANFLLSLPDLDLEDWFRGIPRQFQEPILRQLWNFQTPKELASHSLYEFIKGAWQVLRPGEYFKEAKHVRVIADHLEHATRTPNYNLVLNQPPGTMKSLLSAVIWPAWVWGPFGWPGAKFFYASYSRDYAKRDSTETRDLIQSDWYQSLWPEVEICSDDNRAMEFKLTAGGWRIATGTGGRATGDHPHFIVGDDLNKAADPEKKFSGAINWWKKSMSTRGRILGSRRIVIGQRLRLMEVSQHCLNLGYDRLSLPMRMPAPPQGDKLAQSGESLGQGGGLTGQSGEPGAKVGSSLGAVEPADNGATLKPTALGWFDTRKPGELLCPELYGEEAIREMELELGPIDAAAQLQQRPIRIVAGGLFPRDRVTFMEPEAVPWGEIDRAIRYWDKAYSDSPEADDSAGILIARWVRKNIRKYIVVNAVIGKWNPFQRDAIIEQTAEIDAAAYKGKIELWVEDEGRGAGKQSAAITKNQLARFGVRMDKPGTSKLLRAKPWSSVWHAGNVILVVGAWNGLYLEQHEAFTGEDQEGIHDDTIDGSSGAAGQLIPFVKPSGGKPVGIPGRTGKA